MEAMQYSLHEEVYHERGISADSSMLHISMLNPPKEDGFVVVVTLRLSIEHTTASDPQQLGFMIVLPRVKVVAFGFGGMCFV